MKPISDLGRTLLRLWLAAATVAVVTLAASPVPAVLILSAQPLTTTVNAGSSGNAFDVTLTNNGLSDVTIGAFSFGLSVANPDIEFTEVNTGTIVPYIFGADSAFGPIISIIPPPNGQAVAASDAYFVIDVGVAVTSGTTVGLGHVLFNVSSMATPEFVPIVFDMPPFSSLAAPNFDDIPITIDLSVGIQVEGQSVVPEPTTLLIWSGLSAMALATGRRRRKERGRAERTY